MRVMLIISRSPLPAWRGNQVRTLEWLEALAGHDVALVYPGPGARTLSSPPAELVPYRLGIPLRTAGLLRAATNGRPLQEGLYDSGAGRRAVARSIESRRPDVAVVQMVRCGWAIEEIRECAPALPVIFDAIDAMGLHFESAARLAPPPMSLAYRAEAARCCRREHELAEAAAMTVAVSERDLAALSPPKGRGRAIPVAGREVVQPTSPDGEPVVLLSGNLGYRPTVRGALWFAREVWPRLRSAAPEARWVLAGARPTAAVRRLAGLPGVEVHADVPDLGSFLAGSRVAIAPMSSGSGVPMKVLEAMAAGLPAVVHPWAADGLVAQAAHAVMVASEADEWIGALTTLLGDRQAATELGRRGHELWKRFYHPERVAEQIREVVAEAAG